MRALVSPWTAALLFLVHAVASAQPTLPQVLQALKPRSIGPANMSGRITEIAVVDKDPRIQYVASATGGLWKTVNHGTTWVPVLDRQATSSIGAVAVFQGDPDIVWVGMGEANARNSVTWGDGVLRSTDGGKTWKHLGLAETRHIGRIALHPKSPDIAYVAAVGKLWGANPERGIFKTDDGGRTWKHVLALDEATGSIDIALDPAEPEHLLAAAYQVRRGPFSGGNPEVQTGPRAGIYRSEDGGASWEQAKAGLPSRPFGRCGLAFSASKPQLVYAVVQTDKTVSTVQGQSPNQKLVLDAGGIFRSDDRGKTWTHLNSLVPRPFYYGQIRIDPQDERRIYVLGVNFHVSDDGGKTFPDKLAGAKGTHVDYHALWIDPADSRHLVLGCDGGLNYSWDRGGTWEMLANLPVSQFYAVGLDHRKPYRVYGGLQDNGSWGGPSATDDVAGIRMSEWNRILAFDGYWCQVDPDDANTVYCEGQYGLLHRADIAAGDAKSIRPTPPAKGTKGNLVPPPAAEIPAFRFNWSSPIVLSPHAPKTLWYGGNHVFKSADRGETWTVASPDLTFGKPGPNDYAGHTLTALVESPQRKGLLFAGSDDGRVHRTRDGGKTWEELTDKIPGVAKNRWITRLECSPHEAQAGTVYLAIDRHRNDDLAPYLFRSDDEGESWKSVAGDLPKEAPIHVVRVDPRRARVLYAGSETGLFVSWDDGKSWHKHPHLPTVPVHDLAIQRRDRELVVATHGRGIYILDIAPLQSFADRNDAEASLSDVKPARPVRMRSFASLGIKAFVGENPPAGAALWFWLAAKPAQPPIVTIADPQGKKVAELKGKAEAGLQAVQWNLMPTAAGKEFAPVPPGVYQAVLRAGAVVRQTAIVVETPNGKD